MTHFIISFVHTKLLPYKVIDCFSRKAWTRPLKSKNAENVALALDDILGSMRRPPRRFCSDRGGGIITFTLIVFATIYI